QVMCEVAGPLDEWKRKFDVLAKTDKIGNVLSETMKLLDILSTNPLSYIDLEYASDSVNAIITVTKKRDLASSQFTLRDCCYGMAEAVEFTARALIANNEQGALAVSTGSGEQLVDQIKSEELDDVRPFDNSRMISKAGNNEVLVNELKEQERVKDSSEPSEQPLFNPMSCCLLPKDEEEELELDEDVTMTYDEYDQAGSSRDEFTLSNCTPPKTTIRMPHQCKFCTKSFTKKCNLVKHERIHTGERQFKCATCKSSFTLESLLVKHISAYDHVAAPQSDSSQVEDPERMKRRASIILAAPSSSSKKYSFTCSFCPKTFPRSHDRTVHERMHTGERKYKCDKCSKRFTQYGHLSKHLRICTHVAGVESTAGYTLATEQFPCPSCERIFSQKSALEIHSLTHTGKQAFYCGVCSRTFSTQDELQSHHKSKHVDDSRFPCIFCEKLFKTEKYSREHIRKFH
ncbi:hypothetical protein PFISCL1PPCAC_7015, partial [Pristionchus fissidentatus]